MREKILVVILVMSFVLAIPVYADANVNDKDDIVELDITIEDEADTRGVAPCPINGYHDAIMKGECKIRVLDVGFGYTEWFYGYQCKHCGSWIFTEERHTSPSNRYTFVENPPNVQTWNSQPCGFEIDMRYVNQYGNLGIINRRGWQLSYPTTAVK